MKVRDPEIKYNIHTVTVHAGTRVMIFFFENRKCVLNIYIYIYL